MKIGVNGFESVYSAGENSLYVIGCNGTQIREQSKKILASFSKKGISYLKENEIPFSFLWVNNKNNEVILVSDCFATFPVYYSDLFLDALLVSNSVKGVQALKPSLNKLDSQYISDYLTYNTAGQELSIYKGIFKLPPAHYLHVKNDEVTICPYWSGKLKTKPSPSNPNLLPEVLQPYLQNSGKKTVGLELSGGLDSSTIAALLSVNKSDQKVHVFSNVAKDVQAKETLLVEETLRMLPYSYVHHKQYADKPYAFVEQLHKFFSEDKSPHFGGYGLFAEPLLKEAENHGVSILYSGFGGDQTLSWHMGGYLVSLYRKRQWVKLMRAAYNERFILAIKRFLLVVPIFYKFKRIRKESCKNGATKYDKAFIAPSFGFMHYQKEKVIDVYRALLCDFYEHKFYMSTRLGHVARVIEGRRTEAKKYGVHYFFVFLHEKIFEFSNSVPMKAHYNGKTARNLLRSVMRGSLPDEVLDKKVKEMEAIPEVSENFISQHKDFLLGRFKVLRTYSSVTNCIDMDGMERHLTGETPVKFMRYFLHAWMMAEFLVWHESEVK